MKVFQSILAVALLTFPLLTPLVAQEEEKKTQTLFTNIKLYDGVTPSLKDGVSVLVEGNLIKAVSTGQIEAKGAQVIDGGGRTLMPGLIDTHVHFQLVDSAPALEHISPQEVAIKMVPIAEDMLMRGFTLTRDTGGNTHGLRNAINAGVVPGPRIVSSGACIGGISSHADFMGATYSKRRGSNIEDMGFSTIADGPDEIRMAMRTEFRKGASFIKIMLGGGLASAYDPLDANTYSLEELKAAVDEAKRWGTYITAHVYNEESVRMGIEAGMTTFEHTHLATEAQYEEFAKRDMTVSQQVAVAAVMDPSMPQFSTPAAKAKAAFFAKSAKQSFEYIKKHNVKAGFGVDFYGSFESFRFNSKAIAIRTEYFSDKMILEQMYKHNMTLINMCGERLPYQDGPLGVISSGAYADLILVEGNPTEDVSILADWENNIDLVMKDGVIYRNDLDK